VLKVNEWKSLKGEKAKVKKATLSLAGWHSLLVLSKSLVTGSARWLAECVIAIVEGEFGLYKLASLPSLFFLPRWVNCWSNPS